MTEDSTQSVLFPNLFHKPVVIFALVGSPKKRLGHEFHQCSCGFVKFVAKDFRGNAFCHY